MEIWSTRVKNCKAEHSLPTPMEEEVENFPVRINLYKYSKNISDSTASLHILE